MSNSDPFELGKALKIPTGLSRGQKASRGAKKAASNAFRNATSKPAFNPSHQTKFGRKNAKQPKEEAAGYNSYVVGSAAGFGGGVAAGYTAHGGQNREDVKTLRRYNRQVGKAFKPPRPHLITELGNASRKDKIGDRPMLKLGHLAAGGAVGGGLGYATVAGAKRETRGDLDRTYRKQQRKKKNAIAKADLERYTPGRKERAKMRTKNAVAGGVTAAGTLAGLGTGIRALENKATGTKNTLKTLKPRNLKVAAGVGGAVGLMSAAGKYDKKQYRVKKAYKYTDDATHSDRRKYKNTQGAAGASSALGGYLIGTGISNHLDSAPNIRSAVGRGFKSKMGKVGTGLAVAGVGGAAVAEQRAKKKGVLVKKNDPFEISKDNQRYRKTKIGAAAAGGYVGSALIAGGLGLHPAAAIPAAAAGAIVAGKHVQNKLGPKKQTGSFKPVTATPKGKKNNFATPVSKSAFGIDHGQ